MACARRNAPAYSVGEIQRLEEVGAEGQDRPGVLERVVGDRVDAEGRPVGRPEVLVRERLVGEPGAAADALQPVVHQATQAAGLELRDHRDPAGSRLARGGHLLHEELLRVGDGHRPPRPALAQARARNAVRIVGPEEARLAPGAEGAAAHRVVGVPLHLHDPALAALRQHPAAGRALAAHGGEPGRHAGHDVLGRDDEGQDRLGRLPAPGGGRGRAAGADDPEEAPAVHPASRARSVRHPRLRQWWQTTQSSGPFRSA